jgi:tRNA(Ile)-lysidine synthase
MTLIEKVTKYADENRMLDGADIILVGVSGGADSVCLLHVMLRLSAMHRFTVKAAHFNHRLRGEESDRDEAFTLKICRDLGVELFTGGGDVKAWAKEHKTGIEEAARKLRYDFFKMTAGKITAETNKTCRVATAHNAEDNIETLLLNLCRGAGLNGLTGIPPVRDIYIRPLLSISRNDIDAYLKENGLTHITDSSNADTIYTRNKLRHEVLPVLKSINPRLSETAANSIKLLKADNDYLFGEAEKLLKFKDSSYIFDINNVINSPASISSRAFMLAAERYGCSLSNINIQDIYDLINGSGASGEISLPNGLYAIKTYDSLFISNKPPLIKTFKEKTLSVNGLTVIEGTAYEIFLGDVKYYNDFANSRAKIYTSLNTFFFEKSKIYGKINVRPRKTGDFIELAGRGGHKSLKKLFIEMKIPRHERELIPVICDEQGVLAVFGIGADKRALAEDRENTLVLVIYSLKSC